MNRVSWRFRRSTICSTAGLLLVVASVASCAPVADAPVEEAAPRELAIVDTHIHLYDTTREEGVPWPEPNDILFEPVLPPDFDAVAEKNGLSATVIVEASEWPADNQWVLDLVAHDPARYIGLVGSLEFGAPGFDEALRDLSQDPRFVGLRLRQRPGGEDFFSEAVWQDFALMAELGKTLDVLMYQFSLEDVARIAERVPALEILVNHVAGAAIDGQAPDPEWVAGVEAASSFPNVHCKISGLFQQSNLQPSPTELSFYAPVLDVLWESFGEDRLIYGSNWPVTRRGGTYGDYMAIVLEYFEPKGQVALEKLMAQNALAFYGLSLAG